MFSDVKSGVFSKSAVLLFVNLYIKQVLISFLISFLNCFFYESSYSQLGWRGYLMNNLKMDVSVDCILSQAQKRIDELQQVIEFLQKQLEKAPEGSLYGTSSHFQLQWQRIIGEKRIYLSGGKSKLIKALAQKKYNALLLEDFKRQRKALRSNSPVFHRRRWRFGWMRPTCRKPLARWMAFI